MKRNISLGQLYANLEKFDTLQHDRLVPSSAMHFEDDGTLSVRHQEPDTVQAHPLGGLLAGSGVVQPHAGTALPPWVVDPNSHMLGQVADALDIPVRYLRRMAEQDPALMATNCNRWLADEQDKGTDYLLRTYRRGGGNFTGRALLSSRYRIIDNLQILAAAVEVLEQELPGGWTPVSCDLTERTMQVRIACPSVVQNATELLGRYRGPGGAAANDPRVFSGLQIGNSETGGGSFYVVPRALVQVCTNGMMGEGDIMRRVHVGRKLSTDDPVEWSQETREKELELIMAQLRDAVRTFTSREYLAKFIARLEGQAQRELQYPAAATNNVCKALGYTKAERQSIMQAFFAGGGIEGRTAGISYQAVTQAAQNVPDADRAFEMEMTASKVLATIGRHDYEADLDLAL